MGKKGKGKGKGGKGKGKKGKGKGKHAPPAGNTIDETTKQFLVWQIKILEDKVSRYQKQNDELIVASSHFQEKIDQCIADKNDIVNYWKHQLELKVNAYNDLNDRFLTLKQILENEQDQCRKQMAQIRREADDNQSLIVAENMGLNSKLASLEEFRIQKEAMVAKMESLEEELANKNDEYNEVISSMEQKLVLDRERLKSEMIARIKKVAAEFRRVTEKTLNTTIKRTLNENVMVSAQLAKMSDKTVELIEENDRQSANNLKMEQRIKLLESNEKQLSTRFQKSLKLINSLRKECKEQQEIIEEQKRKISEFTSKNPGVDQLKEENDFLSQEVTRLTEIQDNLKEQNLRLTLTSLTDRDKRHEMEQLFTNALEAMKESLMMMEPEKHYKGDHHHPGVDYVKLRNNMLESLVVLMKSSSALGIVPEKEELPPIVKKTISYIPGAQTQSDRNNQPLAHYTNGCLGITPKKLDKLPTALDKMKTLKKRSDFSKYYDVMYKNYSVQTQCTPISLLYSGHMFDSNGLKEPTSKLESKKTVTESIPQVKPKSCKNF